MSNIVVITGASSGFGALTARALAEAGNTVYAGMRETAGRNASLPAGLRPYRVHIDPADDGSEEVSRVADRIRREFLTRVDLADLLTATPRG